MFLIIYIKVKNTGHIFLDFFCFLPSTIVNINGINDFYIRKHTEFELIGMQNQVMTNNQWLVLTHFKVVYYSPSLHENDIFEKIIERSFQIYHFIIVWRLSHKIRPFKWTIEFNIHYFSSLGNLFGVITFDTGGFRWRLKALSIFTNNKLSKYVSFRYLFVLVLKLWLNGYVLNSIYWVISYTKIC